MANNVHYLVGNELFVYLDASTAPLAYATECSLSITADQIDTSNKQSGVWASALPGQLSWSISASALYTSEANYHTLFQKFKDREKINVMFGCITSLKDSSFNMKDSFYHYSGNAFITSMELNAGNGEVASFSVEFTGEGELAEAGNSLPTE